MRHSEAKGYETGQSSMGSSKRGFFCHILIFLPHNAKRFTLKAFSEASLVLLTLRLRTVF